MAPRPYRIQIADSDIADLKQRLQRTRWPDRIKDSDWSRGVPQDYLRKLADYWRTTFDWRKQEAKLNQHAQFTADIDGQCIHFFHVKSKQPGATPLMLLHGWPSTNVEFLRLIEPLTDPVAHGGRPEDAFHVVLPATPGFGLSSPLTEHWHAVRTAKAYRQLMQELGYETWGVHGGDVGSDIAGEINHIEKNLLGVHVSTDMAAIIWYARFTGADPLANPGFSDQDRADLQRLIDESAEDGGYLEIQKTRPLTIGYALTDSPVGQLAWIVEKFKMWTDANHPLPEDAVELDHLLTTISLYWFTKSGASAADFLCSNLHLQRDWGAPSFAPMGMACFGARKTAQDIQDPQRQLKHWTNVEEGGHFPAMEVPDLLAADIRKFFGSLKNQ